MTQYLFRCNFQSVFFAVLAEVTEREATDYTEWPRRLESVWTRSIDSLINVTSLLLQTLYRDTMMDWTAPLFVLHFQSSDHSSITRDISDSNKAMENSYFITGVSIFLDSVERYNLTPFSRFSGLFYFHCVISWARWYRDFDGSTLLTKWISSKIVTNFRRSPSFRPDITAWTLQNCFPVLDGLICSGSINNSLDKCKILRALEIKSSKLEVCVWI